MLLHVNDMGLVPDGRFLEHASIEAESSVLTDADSNLRATDVGKNIAVPGAVDLSARIIELVDRKDVADASMDAGILTGDILTAVFAPKEDPFGLHNVKQRITVAGAGPGGATLVSDVVEFVSKNKLRLATPAATTVNHVEAILNRPDRVALDDHARASANDVTVDLNDRIIHDGSMIIGGRGLESPTARFSSLDLCKKVNIRGAGLLVTTIQSFQTSGQVTLAQSAQRTASGLADIWKTDSRPAFAELLAALDSSDVEGAEIEFGPGVYDFKARNPPHGVEAAIALSGLRNLTLRGAGPGATVLRLMPNQSLGGSTHVIRTLDCKNLTIRDLSVHGAYLTLAQVNEQMHGVLIDAGSEEIVIDQVKVFQSSGDGIRLIGDSPKQNDEPVRKVSKVWVNGCRLIQNKRTGIGFQRLVEFVWIRDCYIEAQPPTTDDGIHFELSRSGSAPKQAPTDIVIDGNVLVQETNEPAVTIQGLNGADPALRVKFINNTVQGGGIRGLNAQDVTVTNNTIVASERGQVVNFRGVNSACRDLSFSNNKIVAGSGVATALLIASDPGFASSRVRIESNYIETQGSGIEFSGSSGDIMIIGNIIEQVVPNTNAILAGAGSVIVNNLGYNPVGSISNSWPLNGTDLTNRVPSGSAAPQSGRVYIIRNTPKTIIITGGNVSQIRINGADAGSIAGTYKLGVGETIAVTYTSPPGTLVFAE
jgi:hypothetical protein